MTSGTCAMCSVGATGEKGHERLELYVSGPYPGHFIFKCSDCGERWIRHHGITQLYGWTRYAEQFSMRQVVEPAKRKKKRELS